MTKTGSILRTKDESEISDVLVTEVQLGCVIGTTTDGTEVAFTYDQLSEYFL